MKHILIIPCLILCSCLVQEEAEYEEASLSPGSLSEVPSSSSVELAEPLPSSSSSVVVPSSSSVESTEPSILGCPIEDLEKVGKYPLPENDSPLPPNDPDKRPPPGLCNPSALELSEEELSFNAQGGVRCMTSSKYLISLNGNGCREETMLVSDSINNPPQFIGVTSFKRLVCPWFIATMDNSKEGRRTLHISVNKNETGKEREMSVGISMGNCGSGVTITQSAGL